MSSRCMFCDAMKDTDAEMVCLSCFDDMVNGKDDLVFRLQEENDKLKNRIKELDNESEEYLESCKDLRLQIEGLEYENKELKEENDFLLKRVEELESNLCPSCGNI